MSHDKIEPGKLESEIESKRNGLSENAEICRPSLQKTMKKEFFLFQLLSGLCTAAAGVFLMYATEEAR
mgnify:CR=1 FL=1